MLGEEKEGVCVGGRGGGGEGEGEVYIRCTLSLRRTLAPAFRRDCAVVAFPLSAAKWRADLPVLCDDGG